MTEDFLYKGMFCQNIEAAICEILRKCKNKYDAEIWKRIYFLCGN